MANPLEPHKNELESTYVVQDRQNEEERTRVTIQDQMLTSLLGGILPEQTDPTRFHSVLDVACGTGGWAIEAAKTYPTMSLVGVDISKTMIDFAHERANAEQVAERARFSVMDTLRLLEFRPQSFDLVNLRFGISFLRTWDWARLLTEFQRVTRRKGIIRITECDTIECNKPALSQLEELIFQALYNAGHLFRPQGDGLTSELAPLFIKNGLRDVQTCVHTLIYQMGTPEGNHLIEDVQHSFRTMRPFIQKWINIPDDYDTLYQQALAEMQEEDFEATWRLVTAWGTVTRTTNAK